MSEMPRPPDPRMLPSWDPAAWFAQDSDRKGYGTGWQLPGQAAEQTAEDDGYGRPEGQPGGDAFLRPFILTEGRTRPLHDGLRIETLIMASPASLSAPIKHERRQIVELCQHPLSLAEIAVALGVPLGVARVLVADLVAESLISLREPTELPVHVIERIRDLVREL